jgi:salicylate biosynthesis isochorismate synthase/menaquinone-specific isochorismate synthase
VPAEASRAAVGSCVERALARAAASGRPVVAAVAIELDPETDVAACVFASRGAEERYFVWEQPERDRFAIGGLGEVVSIDDTSGTHRFEAASLQAAEVMRDAVIEADLSDAAAGPLWVGGFAFASEGGRTPEWATYPPALLVLPELALVRRGADATATVTVLCRPGAEPEPLTERMLGRLAGLRHQPLPLVDPDPAGGYDLKSVRPPEEFERAVSEAARSVAAGHVRKIVLAREVTVSAAAPFKPAAVFGALRSGYPSCYCFCVGTPEAAFVGASPELLVRRSGSVLSTVALAGSTRRSADPAVDDHLGERLLHSAKDLVEHRIVVRTIERALAPHSVWVTTAEEPSLVKVANIQHLATPIRALLAEPRSVIALAGALHPTSAVGGEPWDRARGLLPDLERLDRGWYAGPIGWMDVTEDGELCVALRCTLITGNVAHCYAGGGIVADSDPEAELAETEVKLQAVLPALTGA